MTATAELFFNGELIVSQTFNTHLSNADMGNEVIQHVGWLHWRRDLKWRNFKLIEHDHSYVDKWSYDLYSFKHPHLHYEYIFKFTYHWDK